MPGAPLSLDEIMAISTAVESAYNTFPVLAASYRPFYVRSANLPNPDREKFDNDGFLGTQQEGPTVQRSGFLNPPTAEFGGDVDTSIFSVFARRSLGKADPTPAGADILLAAEVFRHKFRMLGNRTAAGRQLPSSTLALSNDELDYLFAGSVFNALSVSQNGGEVPQYSTSLVGSGMYKKIDTIGGFGTIAPPAIPVLDDVMMGGESEVEYTTSGGTKFLAQLDYATPHTLKNINLTIVNNNHDTSDKRAGAKRLDSTTPDKGWVLSYLLHGKRSAGGTIRVEAQSGVDEMVHALNDTLVTDFTYRMYGEMIDDADPDYRHTAEVIYPQCYFRNVQRVDDGGGLFLDATIFPTSSGVSTDPDFVEVNVVNGVATSIV